MVAVSFEGAGISRVAVHVWRLQTRDFRGGYLYSWDASNHLKPMKVAERKRSIVCDDLGCLEKGDELKLQSLDLAGRST
jgi:hypothetical protein